VPGIKRMPSTPSMKYSAVSIWTWTASSTLRARELAKEYLRGESGAVALIDDLLAKDGTTIDRLIVAHLSATQLVMWNRSSPLIWKDAQNP
jgi:hypothetical protein